MTKRLLAGILLILLSLSGYVATANHMMGGDMYYTYLGLKPGDPTRSLYRLSAVIYRNCNGGGAALEGSYPFGVYNALNNTLIQTVNLGQVSFVQLGQYAPGCSYPSSVCIQEGMYEGIIEIPNNLTGNPGFHISMYSWRRNTNINNIATNGGNQAGPDGMVWYCYIPPHSFQNSSPRFLAKPLPYMCVGREFRFNHNGFDPDGDSLVFSFAYPYGSIGIGAVANNTPQGVAGGVPNSPAPIGLANNPRPPGANSNTTFWFGGVQYQAGYSFPNTQINSLGGMTINPYTGEISVTPTQAGNFVIAVEVKEYRVDRLNDTTIYLGSIRRDLQFLVGAGCANNFAPVVTNIPDSFVVEAGTPLNFNFLVFDAEGDSVIIDKQGSIFDASGGFPPPYANLPNVSGLQVAQGSFSWTPSCAYARVAPYFFSILVRDNQCNATQKTVFIKVIPKDIIKPPSIQCVDVLSNNSIRLSYTRATGSVTDFQLYRVFRRPFGSSNWTQIDSINNWSSGTYTDNTASNALTQRYEYRMISVNQCKEEGLPSNSISSITLTGNRYSADRVQLRWTRPSFPTSFTARVRIQRSVNGGPFNTIDSIPSTDTVYNDKWCTSSVTYRIFYIENVTGCQIGTITPNSFTLFDTIRPSRPTILVANVSGTNRVEVTIQSSDSSDVANYRLLRSVNGGPFTQINTINNAFTATHILTDFDSPSGRISTCYRVIATDICGLTSDSSNTHCISQLTGTPGQLSINLRWSNYTGRSFATWRVQKLQGSNWVTLPGTGNVPDSVYTDNSAMICNQLQTYRVKFFAPGSDTTVSHSSQLVIAPFDTIRPATPVTYNATVWNATQNRVSFFTVADADVNRYQILASVNGGPYSQVGQVLNPTPGLQTFQHTGINTTANTYTYRIQAVDTCNQNRSDSSAIQRPILLSGNPGNLSAWLSWTPYVGYTLSRHRIQRLIGTTWTDIGFTDSVATSFRDSGTLACNVTYRYRLLAEKSADTLGNFSNEISVTPFDTLRPTVPVVLLATVNSANSITYSFLRSTSADVNRYQVFGSTNNGPWNLLATLNPPFTDTLTFTQTPVNARVNTFRYRVVAIDSCNNNRSDSSIIHSPVRITGTAGQLRANLSWPLYVGFNPDSQRVQKLSGTNWINLASLNGVVTSYTDSIGLACNVPQTYRLLSFSPGGLISQSSDITVTPFDTIPPTIPQIRNISIPANGVVQVTWNASPSVDVNRHSIWNSFNGAAATSVLDTLVRGGNLGTFVSQFNSNTQLNNCVFATAADSCSNRNSPNSPTFCAITLNGSPGNLRSNLSWSAFAGYNLSNYQIERQSPGSSSWVNIGSVSATTLSFVDSVNTPCNNTFNYRISGVENGGSRTTLSNTISVTPFDTIRPNAPSVHNVSVFSSGSVQITFTASNASDVDRHLVYRSNGGAFQLIDTIRQAGNGANVTWYDSTASTASAVSYCYYLVALDSCQNNASAPSDTDCTVRIEATGNSCARVANLTWSGYQGWNNPVSRYEIYRSDNGGPFNLQAQVTGTTTAFSQASLPLGVDFCYQIVAVQATTGTTSNSNIFCLTLGPPAPPVVTAASVTQTSATAGEVQVRWSVPAGQAVSSLSLYYASGRTGGMTLLQANIPPTQTSFTHQNLNTKTEVHRYYLTLTDTCANTSAPSDTNRTMDFSIQGGQVVHQMNWSPYLGWPVQRYRIHRFDPSGLVVVDSVPGTDTVYTAFPAPCNRDVSYKVEAVGPLGQSSFSDTAQTRAVDILPPNAPILRNATVISNNRVQISFTSADSVDIFAYSVRRSVNGGSFSHINFVAHPGPGQSLNYLDTTNTLSDQLCYVVVTLDSCLNATASDTFCVVQLKAEAQQLQNTITWSRFRGYNLANQILERWNGTAWVTLATLSPADTQFVHSPLPCSVTERYRLTVNEAGGSRLSLSDTTWATPFDTVKPARPTIRWASIRSNTTALLKWQANTEGDLAGYRIYYRSANTPWTFFSQTGRVDSIQITGLNTLDSTYSFALAAFDTCGGNRSDTAFFHSTVQLKGTAGNLSNALNWSPYVGFAGISQYYIERLTGTVWSVLDSVNGLTNTYNHQNLPCNQAVVYRIRTMATDGSISLSDTLRRIPFDTIPPVAPVIRNLTVLNNSSLIVNWDPADFQVGTHEIYLKSLNGSWVLSATVGNVSTHTITGLNTLDSAYCVRIQALDTCAFNRSAFSQEHCSVQLNGVAGNQSNTLNWTPYAGFQSWKYYIEQPGGTGWIILDSVASNLQTFVHQPLACNVTQTYRIRALNLLTGFSAVSDTLMRTPFDTVKPNRAILQAVSVTGPNSILVSWQAGPSPDVNRYEVWRANAGGTFTLIATVTNQTSYTDNVPAATQGQRYQYQIIAIDSCNLANRSEPSLPHLTMNLTSRTGACSPAVVLNWSAYPYFNGGLGNYQVLRSQNNGPFTPIATVAATDTFYTDNGVNVTSAYCYRIQANSLVGNNQALSDSTCIAPAVFATTPAGPMVYTSVTATGISNGAAFIAWTPYNPAIDTLARGYRLYHSTVSANGPWNLIGTFNQVTPTSFNHTNINTRTGRNFYAVRVIDSCGFEGDSSAAHSPTLLQVNNGNLRTSLFWTRYVGSTPSSFSLEKSLNGGPFFVIPGILPTDTSYTDTLIRCGQTYTYRIQQTIVSASGNTNISLSDTVQIIGRDSIAPDVPVLLEASVTRTDVVNGEVTLQYTGANQDNRNGYRIYRSINSGPFTPTFVANTGTGQFSFTDQNLNTRDNTYRYFITSTDSCGNESDSSAIHITTNLTVTAVNGANALSWTAYAGFPNVEYEIERKTAGTAWVSLGKFPSTQLAFDDSLVKCDTIYFYRITALNITPVVPPTQAFAYSDTTSAKAFESIPPLAPAVHQATVEQTSRTQGSVRVNWQPSASRDAMRYIISRSTSGGTFIQVADLGLVTSWLDTAINTVQETYTYRIEVIDSCFNRSTSPSVDHTTMVLNTTPSNEAAILNWTPYGGWTVNEYEIWRDNVKVGSVSGAATSYTDTNLFCTTTYRYTIVATQLADTARSWSNHSDVRPFDTRAPQPAEIISVSVDSSNNGKIVLKWKPSPSFDVQFYQILKRENGSNRLSPLGNVFGNTDSIYVDSLSFNVGQNSFCYSLIAFDFCGNIGDTSNQGCSINLEVAVDPNPSVVQNVLTWNAYEQFKAGTDRYEILRSADGGQTWDNLASLPAGPASLTYTDNQLPDSSGAACYVIIGYENTGGFDAISRSDKVCVIQPARIQIPNVFTANDDNLNDTFGPIGTFFTAYTVSIYDRWGNEVFRSSPDRLRWNGRHQNGGPLSEGNYTYLIEVTDLNGKTILKEGRVTLLK